MFRRRNLCPVVIAAAAAACSVAPGGDPEPGGTRSRDPAGVTGIEWRWLGTQTPVESIEAADPSRYTLLLGTDGRAAVRLDCNSGGADYRIGDGSLQFGVLVSTRMACPADTQDHVFLRQLEAVHIFFIEDGFLYLDLFADGGTMRFAPTQGARGQK